MPSAGLPRPPDLGVGLPGERIPVVLLPVRRNLRSGAVAGCRSDTVENTGSMDGAGCRRAFSTRAFYTRAFDINAFSTMAFYIRALYMKASGGT